MVTAPSSLNDISNIHNATDDSLGLGIRDDLDLNPGTFRETVGKSLTFSESVSSSIKCG